MANVVRRGHVNNAGQPTTLTVVTSDATAAAIEAAAAEAVAPVQEQLDELTEAIADGTATGTSALQTLTVALTRGRRSGSTIVEPEGGFSDTQIGAPVMVTMAPHQGAIDTVLFAGEILNSRQMRLHWSAPGPAPSRVVVNYIIGSR
jgi:hypothetical protein